MTPRTNKHRESARLRADLAFDIYSRQTPRRSLNRLADQLRQLGAPIALATLKRYSSKHHWQDRLGELDAEAAKRRAEDTVEERIAMHERHAQLARALQSAGGTALQSLLGDATRITEMSPGEIVRLLEAGLKADTRATGASGDRRDIAIDVWNDVVVRVVQIFTDINEEPEPEARARLFARGIDALVSDRLSRVRGGGSDAG